MTTPCSGGCGHGACRRSAGFEVVAKGGSRTRRSPIAQSFNPDVMLADISMPARLNAIPAILSVAPSQKIVMLTVPRRMTTSLQLSGGAKLPFSGDRCEGVADRHSHCGLRRELCRPHPFRQAADGPTGQSRTAKSNLVD